MGGNVYVIPVANEPCTVRLKSDAMRCRPCFSLEFTVLRLLTPLNMPYETAKKRAQSYNKIVKELPEMPEGYRQPRQAGDGGEPASLCAGEQLI